MPNDRIHYLVSNKTDILGISDQTKMYHKGLKFMPQLSRATSHITICMFAFINKPIFFLGFLLCFSI